MRLIALACRNGLGMKHCEKHDVRKGTTHPSPCVIYTVVYVFFLFAKVCLVYCRGMPVVMSCA